MSITSCTELEASMREAGRAGGHHVAVVAENRERLRGQRPGRDVEHRGGQFARDLVHVGDHQQQALRCGEGGGERTGLQRAVQRAGRAAFALHLDHGWHACPRCWSCRSADHWSAHSPMLDEGVIG